MMHTTFLIRPMQPEDWPAVEAIYEEGIRSGVATFETQSPGWDLWDRHHIPDMRLVGVIDDEITGWVALSPVSSRQVYRGVAEVSVYVGSRYRGKGIGLALLEKIVALSESAGFWTVQAGIFALNAASIRLHTCAGFRMIGYRERPAQLHGVWYDTVLMERRSLVAGGA
ncbi:MAG: GNAT family N-acetyltransferase [Bacteroidia bacterium]|nr:GNAT family N-acetyltransferase [Bacteroidia bacterium]